jgi:hypothetical protein
MSKPKFTPGPHYAVEYAGFWEMQKHTDYDLNDNLLDSEKEDRAEHNAKLYAAATDMYSLLESIQMYLPKPLKNKIQQLLNRVNQ